MTDADLLAKRLAFIETSIQELRTHALPDKIHDDIRNRRFVEHTLQIAIQAALDVASHIVSDLRLGEPTTNRALFDLLVEAGWLPRDLGEILGDMAGLRNVLVHGYTEVDLGIVHDVLVNRLGDLESFVEAIRRRL
jgi:uncharacterized protein YutE (UPF0331/DUF86 family)